MADRMSGTKQEHVPGSLSLSSNALASVVFPMPPIPLKPSTFTPSAFIVDSNQVEKVLQTTTISDQVLSLQPTMR